MGPGCVPCEVGSSSQKMRGALGQSRFRRCIAIRSRGRSEDVAQLQVPRVCLPSHSRSSKEAAGELSVRRLQSAKRTNVSPEGSSTKRVSPGVVCLVGAIRPGRASFLPKRAKKVAVTAVTHRELAQSRISKSLSVPQDRRTKTRPAALYIVYLGPYNHLEVPQSCTRPPTPTRYRALSVKHRLNTCFTDRELNNSGPRHSQVPTTTSEQSFTLVPGRRLPWTPTSELQPTRSLSQGASSTPSMRRNGVGSSDPPKKVTSASGRSM